MIIKRGDIILVDLEPVKGSEQGKVRPCLIIQNDIGNIKSPTTIVVAITSKTQKQFPFTTLITKADSNLKNDSLVLCNQIRTISTKERTLSRIGKLNSKAMKRVDEALKISLGIN